MPDWKTLQVVADDVQLAIAIGRTMRDDQTLPAPIRAAARSLVRHARGVQESVADLMKEAKQDS